MRHGSGRRRSVVPAPFGVPPAAAGAGRIPATPIEAPARPTRGSREFQARPRCEVCEIVVVQQERARLAGKGAGTTRSLGPRPAIGTRAFAHQARAPSDPRSIWRPSRRPARIRVVGRRDCPARGGRRHAATPRWPDQSPRRAHVNPRRPRLTGWITPPRLRARQPPCTASRPTCFRPFVQTCSFDRPCIRPAPIP